MRKKRHLVGTLLRQREHLIRNYEHLYTAVAATYEDTIISKLFAPGIPSIARHILLCYFSGDTPCCRIWLKGIFNVEFESVIDYAWYTVHRPPTFLRDIVET